MINRLPIPEWPPRDSDIEREVARLFEDGSWGKYSGPATTALCEQLAAVFGTEYVGLCSSGTIGVEIALRAVGVERDHEVILAAYDFPGNFRAIEFTGATPVLVDTSPDSHVIDPANVASAMSPKTRAVIASHLHGQIAPLKELMAICRAHEIALIEDACQVPGAVWQGRPLGGWGDIGVLSFGGSKLLTAGRGGAILASNETHFQRARIFSDRGNDAFPLSQLQAAVLLPQLKKLSETNKTRQARATQLIRELRRHSELEIPIDLAAETAFYKVPLGFPGSAAQRSRFIDLLVEHGLEVGEGFRGFARRSARRCRKVGSLANAQLQAEQTCLLHHPLLLADEGTIREAASLISEVFIRSKNAE